jgi:Protein of unknown function (DUF1566)
MNRRLTCTLGSSVLAVIVFGEPAAAQPAAAPPALYYPVPSWAQTLTAKMRFDLVMPVDGFGPQAVLDRETGLVWQKTPVDASAFEWEQARAFCLTENTGGRMGWRLPTIEELSSLVDLSTAPPSPALPAGHPFNLGAAFPAFWSSTVTDSDATLAYLVVLVGENPGLLPGLRVAVKTPTKIRLWCVRGGSVGH